MADVNKEIALKVTTDIGQTTKQFANAQQELEETRKKLVDLALAGKQTSEEFRTLEKRSGQIQDAIGDVNRRVNTLANDTPKLQLLTEAATGIAGGFAAAQGAAALFAGENEEVQQAILKTQGAMTLLNGVQQVANVLNKDSAVSMQLNATSTRAYSLAVGASTGALKLFRLAFIGLGIGAVVVAIGALVTNWDKLTGAVMKFVDASPLLTKVIGFITDGFQKLGRAIGIIPSESEAATRQMIEDLEHQQKILEAAGTDAFFIQKRLAELRIQLAKETGEGLLEAEDELTLLLAKRFGEQDKARKAELEKARLAREEAIKKAREQDQKALQDLNDALTAMEDARERARKQQALNDERAHLDRMQADAKRRMEESKNEELRAETARKSQEQIDNMKFNAAVGVFQGLADLSAAFAGQSEEAQKRAFNVQKAASIATTVIETIVSAQKAFTSLAAFPPLAFAAAATVSAAGLARVAAIKRTTFTTASTSAAPQAIRPAGVGGQQGTPPPQGFNPNTSTPAPIPPQGGQQGQPMGSQRVYVLERDITDVGRRVQNVERFATFG
jgi:hypothetical protein